ncbi:universal stress protein [Saccharomonospora glauca]|jgi:nucleotide-binding universal stress UspA family protein|uniref:Universal stress protein UspA-like protein n=1 Tax=Saccharomonospora glauca K62 TaxID=928724 RepID=I1D3F6_9PSEU|nr:universal stress protein [Saccharomonospora glauca]EIE99480.1 universal stress protein UspA-like protein [Saccharomonospora glauca K62]
MTSAETTAGLVVGVDGSTPALRATAWAAATATRRHKPLLLVAALEPPTPYGTGIGLPPDHFVKLEGEGREWLDRARSVADRAGGPEEVGTELALGSAPSVLAEHARHAACVVIGGHDAPEHGGRLGPVATALMGRAPCPVAVVRWPGDAENPPGHGPVVVGVDGSPTSVEAVVVAYEEASLRGAPLVAVHSAGHAHRGLFHHGGGPWGEGENAEAVTLAERLAGMRERYPEVEVERVVTRDDPTPALLHHAEAAQLLVVGSTGHRELSGRLLGSTSHALARAAPCPLLVVPGRTGARTQSGRTRRRERTRS